MQNFANEKICGYYLYFTSHCVIEAMHAHASDKKLTEEGSAKFFVKANGDTELMKKGTLSDIEVRKISAFIKDHYLEMHDLWLKWSDNDYYRGM